MVLRNNVDRELEIKTIDRAKAYFMQEPNSEWYGPEEAKFNEELEEAGNSV